MSELSGTVSAGTAWVLPQVSLSSRVVPALCLCWVRNGGSPADEQHKGERRSRGRGDAEVVEVGRGRWIEVAVRGGGSHAEGAVTPPQCHRTTRCSGRDGPD